MMLVDNLIHADLHPGNILVQLDVPKGLLGLAYDALASIAGSAFLPLAPAVRKHLRRVQASWLQPRLVLLDVGMATELSPEDQTNMLGLFKCFAALDGRGAGTWILRFSGDQQTCEKPEAFLSDLEATFDELRKTQVGVCLAI
jgi:aarF domain-containing kinase